MSRNLVWCFGAAALAVLALAGGPGLPSARAAEEEEEPHLVGRYTSEGESSVGGTFSGKVVIAKKGSTYLLTWDIKGEKIEGMGIRTTGRGEGDTLSVCYKYKGDVALVVYRVSKKDDGPQLVGRWSYLPGDGKVFKETLTFTGK